MFDNYISNKFLEILNLHHLTNVSEITLIRMRMTMRVCVISFIFGSTYALFLPFLGLPLHSLISFICAFGYIIIAAFIYYNKFETAKILHTFNSCWGIFSFACFLGKNCGHHLFILLSPIFVLSLYDLKHRTLIFVSISMYILTFLLFLKYDINPIFPIIHSEILTDMVIKIFYMIDIVFIIILSTIMVTYILKLNNEFAFQILQKNITLRGKQKLLSNEITIKKASEAKIQLMYEELQVSYDRLRHFNQMVSHNLRSPIGNLIGLSQMVDDKSLTVGEKKEIVVNINKTATKLDEVIKDMNQILTINKDVNEVKSFVDLQVALKKVLESEGKVLEKINAKLITDFSKAKGFNSVSSFIHSIFHNFISNSIKYRRPNTVLVITIQSDIDNDMFILKYSDNGSGIDLTKNNHKIFKPYTRFHDDIEGKGIGLYLVQSQIQMLGGKISVESAVNMGTTFTIMFPMNNVIA